MRKIKERIQKNLDNYYPNQNCKLKKIERLKPSLFTRLFRQNQSLIFKCKLSNGKKIFIKKQKIPNLKDWKKLNDAPIPRLLDYFEDMIVMEGVDGSSIFSKFLLQPSKSLYYAKKAGESLAKLQNLTFSGFKKPKDKDIIGPSLKLILNPLKEKDRRKIENKIEEIKKMKLPITGVCGDLTPYNIFVNKEVFFIDLSYMKGFFFQDSVHFLTSVELMQRIPFFKPEKINNIFLKSYMKNFQKIDENIFSLLKLMKYLGYLYGLRSKSQIKYLKNPTKFLDFFVIKTNIKKILRII